MMLKVNTKKISVENFAKKYGMTEEKDCCCKYMIYKENYIRISIDEFGMLFDFPHANGKYADILFDMISSGDIIKEEAK